MQNNPPYRFILECIQHIAGIALVVTLSLFTAACSGGISGTGDGRPVIIEPGETGSDTTVIDGVGGTTDSNAAPTANTNLPTLPELSLAIPTALLEAHGRNESISESAPFTQQLILVSTDFEQIQSELSIATDAAINTAVNNYFDSSVEHSLSGDTVIRWSSDNAAISVFSTNADRIIYFLQVDETLTIRRFDRNTNVLFQAAIDSPPENNSESVLETTLNNNGINSYLRAYSSGAEAGATVTFIQHPTNISIERQREIIDQSGAVIDIQTCTVASSPESCQSDANWAVVTDSGNGTASQLFTTAINNINARLELRQTPIPSIPQEVNEAVIATTTEQLSAAENIQCGLQVVDGTVRAFCVEPLPLEASGTLFQEILSGGEVFYQLLPNP